MDIPKPHAPRKLVDIAEPTPTVEPIEVREKTKPVFVRKPHLTDRPFREHEGLAALRSELNAQENRQPRRPRPSKKGTSK